MTDPVTITRKTAETDISLTLALSGSGTHDVATGCGFLDHMLTLFAVHGGFDLTLRCAGDTAVDDHHTVEDVGICLGDAVKQALGDGRGIARYGDALLPMDEALLLAAVDVSGRGVLAYDLGALNEKVGTTDTEVFKEFFAAFTRRSGVTLHLRALAGENTHHKIEGAFKAFARALSAACRPTGGNAIPSTKGLL